MKKKLLLPLFILLLSYHALMAQNTKAYQYLPNVVDIENNSFGLIVGQNPAQGEVYFIALTNKQSGEAELPSKLNIRYYKLSEKAVATRISKTTVADQWVYLYRAPLKAKLDIRDRNYTALSGRNSYQSYIDNGEVDSIWYSSEPPFKQISQEQNGKHVLQTDRGNFYYRGMPLIDDQGNLAGLLTTSTGSNSERFRVPEAISMADIAKRLYEFDKCSFFQMVETGQVFNPCDRLKNAQVQKNKEEDIYNSNNQVHALAIGHALTLNGNFSSGPNGSSMAGFGYAAGLNIYINPDKGKVRLLLSPRFNHVPFKVNANVSSTYKSGFLTKKFRANTVDMPVVLEFVTKRQIKGYGFFGIGYVPGYQFDGKYIYSADGGDSKTRAVAFGTAKFTNKVLLEIGTAGARRRAAFFVAYQFTGWTDQSYTTVVNGITVAPFNGFGSNGYFSLGLEFSSRWSGQWGLKSK